jgi:hypothetical protein
LWKAAWSFFDKGEPAAEEWVADQARKVLHGKSAQVAAGIRRRATTYGYCPAERAGADECARYLDNKQDYLGYATALAKGWPIAIGIIEGAARWLVKDRMDITGARWGLEGAEAILKLRALIASGDYPDVLVMPTARAGPASGHGPGGPRSRDNFRGFRGRRAGGRWGHSARTRTPPFQLLCRSYSAIWGSGCADPSCRFTCEAVLRSEGWPRWRPQRRVARRRR